MLRHTLFIAFLLATLLFSGCVRNIHSLSSNTTGTSSVPRDHVIRAYDLSLDSSLNKIMPALADHKVVLVGESHTAYGDHLNQLAVIEGLNKRWPDMAIGLEFVQKPYQKALDDYIAGRIDEAAMLRKTEWYDRWRYDFRLYRPVFRFAKQQGIPLVALNIPRELTKAISKKGLKGLTAAERKQLPAQIDKSNNAYRKSLEGIYKQHMRRSNEFEKFYESQLAWDEGMADTAARYLNKHPEKKMVILAGAGHIINRHGIPSRLERRINTKTAVVLNSTLGDIPDPKQGDFLLISSATKLPKNGLMGIFMEDNAKDQGVEGVSVSKTVRTGAAARAGMQKGDILIALNGKKVRDTQDIKIQLLDSKPGDKLQIRALRKGKAMIFNLVLQSPKPMMRRH
jgi:uncharacterized iron-regulated protein